jgi:NAD(P)-dependent dehydrogenase (short-subunit alcohol dehydrogenase family)
LGDAVRFVQADLTHDEAPRRVIASALEWRERIDGLVNNAGVGCVGRADKLDDVQFDTVFAVNVRASFRLTREAVKWLTKPGASIVNLASVHGRQPLVGFSAYAATKGAVEAMTRGWAVDFGPDGIRVNCVVPGMVDCPQTREVTAQQVADVELYLDDWRTKRQLLPNLVTNQNVGELVVFLLDSRSQGITGQSIVIDAGTTLMLTDRD